MKSQKRNMVENIKRPFIAWEIKESGNEINAKKNLLMLKYMHMPLKVVLLIR